MTTITEVSRRAGVSTATVSRVLNDSGPVKAVTRERVLAAVRELNFQPNTVAQALVSGRSFGIGVMVGDLASPYFGMVLKGVETVVREAGLHLLISSGDFDLGREREALDFLRQRRAEALIVQVDVTPDDTLIQWAQAGTPLVVFGRCIPELEGRCICLNNDQGGYLATRHLVAQGHRRIAHVTGPLRHADCRARLQGYRRALNEAGFAYEERLVAQSDFTEEGGLRSVQQLLERGEDFTAIFLDNDQMAAGALVALRAAGRAVPDDVSLVGYDDVVLARYLYPTLTTVRQPLVEMGQAAARLALGLLQLQDQQESEVQRNFDPELVIRHSVQAVKGGTSTLGTRSGKRHRLGH